MSDSGGVAVPKPESMSNSPEPLSKTPEPPAKTPEPAAKTPEPPAKSPTPAAKTPEPPAKTPEPPSKTPEPPAKTPTPAKTPEPPAKTPEPPAKTPTPAAKTPEPPAKTPEPQSGKKAENGTGPAGGGKKFSETFKLFSKFGDTKSDGKLITLSQSDKWMKQAKVIDGKTVTTTDTGIYFKKLKSLKVSEADYKKFLEELAKSKKVDLEEMKKKMANSGPPGVSTSSAAGKQASAVERLTDTSKYTGSHRQRFDESGKGKGIAGRKDIPDSSGYVSGYQNKNTYDKTHPTQ